MGDIKPLANQEAIAELKRIAQHETAMLCTFADDGAMHTRPMATPQIDDDGTLWLMSRADSAKNREIERNGAVQLIYAVPSRSEYLSLEGDAVITRDRAKIDELWSGFMKTWFHEGKDDPQLTLIRVTPRRGYYWDTKHGKAVQLVKIAIGALTSRELDDGVEGTLNP